MFGIRADQHLLRIDRSTKRWLIILLTIVLSLGVFFRIANLGVKPIWLGEAYTRSVISGYSESEALDKIPTGEIVNVEGFLKYQYPNSEKTIGDTFRKLYTDNHALLYFLLAHYWVKLFGHSVTVLRSMSAVLSILAVSCIYWFCMELFELPLVGWMASALLSVSPIQVIYAQDAGSSSLLSLVILLSGASLLWSLRTQKKAWFTYAISLVLGIYSEYFFILVILGYLAYVFSIESFRFTQKFQCFLLVTFASLLAFLPWFTIILFHLSDFQAASAWMSQHNLTLLGGISLWVENTSLSFIDLVDPKASEYNGLRKFDFYFLTPPILILVGYSIYLLRLRMSKRVYLFVISLIGSTALPLITIDWVFGGNRQI